MHIIFGDDTAVTMSEKYTVLELDQMRLEPGGSIDTAYCVIESLPLHEIPEIEQLKHLHTKLMENYRKKDWNFCEQAISHLRSRWGGAMTSFYDELSNRITTFKDNDPGADWDGVYNKYSK
jgi:adenylate cyclase